MTPTKNKEIEENFIKIRADWRNRNNIEYPEDVGTDELDDLCEVCYKAGKQSAEKEAENKWFKECVRIGQLEFSNGVKWGRQNQLSQETKRITEIIDEIKKYFNDAYIDKGIDNVLSKINNHSQEKPKKDKSQLGASPMQPDTEPDKNPRSRAGFSGSSNSKENDVCECGHPKNEHRKQHHSFGTTLTCFHYTDPTLKEIKERGEDARGTYCDCKKFRPKKEQKK